MTIIYDVIAERHRGSSRSDVILFYDEDREAAIKFMDKYDKQNGFTIEEKKGRSTIADIILRERTPAGEEISRKSYIEIFDGCGRRRKEGESPGPGFSPGPGLLYEGVKHEIKESPVWVF